MTHPPRAAAERVLRNLSEEQKKSYWRAYGESTGQKIVDLFDKFDAAMEGGMVCLPSDQPIKDLK